jgi:hypothetical protein
MEYVAFLDESQGDRNASPRCFVYGGLLLRVNQLASLHETIARIHQDHGIALDTPLKWSRPTNWPPERTSDWDHAVDDLISETLRLSPMFVATFSPHRIASDSVKSQTAHEWGANVVLSAFDKSLIAMDGHAFILVDRWGYTNLFRYLEDVFKHGTRSRTEVRPLQRVIGFAALSAETSLVGSAADVVVGAFQFCLSHSPRNRPRAARIYDKLRRMRHTESDVTPWKNSLFCYPKKQDRSVRVSYLSAVANLRALGEVEPPSDLVSFV